jgi:hypothetical protein
MERKPGTLANILFLKGRFTPVDIIPGMDPMRPSVIAVICGMV